MNNLSLRIITGSVYVVSLISCLLISKFTFIFFFFLIAFIGLNEYFKMVEKLEFKANKPVGFIISFILFLIFISFSFLPEFTKYLVSSLIFSLFILFISPLINKNNTSIHSISSTLLGLVYVCLPLFISFLIAFENGNYNYQTILSTFIMVWLSDVGGYAIGVKFGKRKLNENISPKKTWEGVIGSLIFCIIGGLVLPLYFETFSNIEWILFSILVCIFSILGDLVESMFKRNANIKDSGTILPGHGGILDRFDSILFVLPMVYLFQIIIK